MMWSSQVTTISLSTMRKMRFLCSGELCGWLHNAGISWASCSSSVFFDELNASAARAAAPQVLTQGVLGQRARRSIAARALRRRGDFAGPPHRTGAAHGPLHTVLAQARGP